MAAPPNPTGVSPGFSEELAGGGGGGGGGSDIGSGGAPPSGCPSLAPNDGGCCGSSNPAADLFLPPEKMAATAVARAWKTNPSSSERYTSGFGGGIELDDDEGVVFPGEECSTFVDDYLMTQQSNIMEKEKGQKVQHAIDSDSDCSYEDFEEICKREHEELNQKLIDMKRKRADPLLHYEGDTEPEDILYESDESEKENDYNIVAEPEPEPEPVRKKLIPKRKGPTSRSHCSQASKAPADFVPSSDDGMDGDLGADDDDDSEQMRWVLPSGRKSRAKKRDARVWYDETRLNPEQQLCLKMCFVNVTQFRMALQTFHIAQLRNFVYHRNCPDRVIARCKEEGCPFYMVGSQIKGEKTICLRKLMLDHTCATSGEHCKVTRKWLAKVCENSLRIDPRTAVETLMETTKEKFGVDVPKMMAYRAKRSALQVVLGDHIKQYTRIRDYLETVLETNPGSRCIVTTKVVPEHPSPNPRFHGMFYCLGASIQGFLNGCRPFIGLDGCFIKLSTGQQLLAAVGRDGNNNIYPIAFGVVDKEETASWSWFLTQLKYALGGESGKFGYYTIISDRQKGLLNAINAVFPNCPQRFCLRHIYANFQSAGFKGEELKKFMDSASYSYTKHGFDVAMEGMKNECVEAWEWLCKIPVECWARHAMDHNCKTDLVVNNLSECFNRMILDVRSKPVKTMMEGIRSKMMVKYNGKRDGASNARWEITPTYSEKLAENKKWSRPCRSAPSKNGLWQVTSGLDNVYAVDLTARTCGCKKWDMTGIPCHHAISAIYKSYQHPEDFVHDYFKKPMYLEAYDPVIYPVPGQDCWRKTNTPDIDPPVFKLSVGRAQTKRRKGQFEVPQPKSTSRMGSITCSNCGRLGHRYTSCDQTLKPALEMRKNKHKEQRAEGHDSNTHATAQSSPVATPAAAARMAASAAAPSAAAPLPAAAARRTAPAAAPRPPQAAPPRTYQRRAFTAPRSNETALQGVSDEGRPS